MTTPAAGAAGTPAAAVPAAGGTPAAGVPPAAFDWGSQGLAPEVLGYVTNKGWKTPADTIESYRNFEKLHGVPADRLLKVPGPDAKPEEIAAFRERLGAPKDAKEYKFAEIPGFGENKDAAAKFDGFLRSAFHKNGVSGSAAEGITKEWSTFVAQTLKAEQDAADQAFAADQAKLKTELGPQYDKYVNVAKQAGVAFGLKAEDVDALAANLGFSATMKFLHTVGSKLGEGDYASGDHQAAYGPEAALAEIQALKKDPGFGKKLLEKDAESLAKWNRLHQVAYPGQITVS